MKKIYASKEWIENVKEIAGYPPWAEPPDGFIATYWGMPIIYKPELKGNLAYIFDDDNKNVKFAIEKGLGL